MRLTWVQLEDLLPHTVVDARPGAHGAGLWSRFRLVDDQRHDRLVFAAVSARLVLLSVEASGVGYPGGGVVEVEAAGAVEGLLGGAGG